MSALLAGKRDPRFPRSRRLTRSAEFRAVFTSNCRSGDRFFSTFAQEENAKGIARLGVTVSRRTATRSVDRNRIKRAIRESFRHEQGKLAGLDVVVVARPPSRSAKNQTLFESLERHWQNICQKK